MAERGTANCAASPGARRSRWDCGLGALTVLPAGRVRGTAADRRLVSRFLAMETEIRKTLSEDRARCGTI